MKFTHKGWYWFCPIYIREGSDEFLVAERHALFAPLFWLASKLDEARIFVTSLLVKDYEPEFMFKVTGEL